MAKIKRPLLTTEDRARLRTIANQIDGREQGATTAYGKGVVDLIRWLDGGDMSPLLQEVIR